MRRGDVPEMGGQHGDARIDVTVPAVRVDVGADGKGMAEVAVAGVVAVADDDPGVAGQDAAVSLESAPWWLVHVTRRFL
jgi:hypothetical protein